MTDFPYKVSSTLARKRGGQHVGTGPSVIRVELKDDDGFVVCAVEVNDGYHGKSQHGARQLAMQALELAMSEYRYPPACP